MYMYMYMYIYLYIYILFFYPFLNIRKIVHCKYSNMCWLRNHDHSCSDIILQLFQNTLCISNEPETHWTYRDYGPFII